MTLGPDSVEVHGTWIAVERLCDCRKVERLGVALDLLGWQLGQEAPQPIALEIDGGLALGLVDDVHASFSAGAQYSAKRGSAIAERMERQTAGEGLRECLLTVPF